MKFLNWFKNLFTKKEATNGLQYENGVITNPNAGLVRVLGPKNYPVTTAGIVQTLATIQEINDRIFGEEQHINAKDQEFILKTSRDYEKKKSSSKRRRKLQTSRRNKIFEKTKQKSTKRTKKAKSRNS